MTEVQELLAAALTQIGYQSLDDVNVSRASSDRGDYSSTVALQLAAEQSTSAIQIARRIAEQLRQNEAVADVAVAGGGYVNWRMSEGWLDAQLQTIDAASDVQLTPPLERHKYIIEYSSPNIAKPMHIGHLRTTILGQSLVNLWRAVGAEVIAWSHPGDWGTQFGKLIVAWRKWGDQSALQKQPIAELLRVYVKFHQMAEHHPELDDQARAAYKSLQDGDEESQALWRQFTEYSQREFMRLYTKLQVSFDVVRGESSYNHLVQPLVEAALTQKVAKMSDGAVIIPLEQYQLPPLLIRKSDGATLYATADLASIGERIKLYQPDELIYVVGNEQTLHFQQVFAAAEQLCQAGVYGRIKRLPKLTHVSYGFFRLPGGKMSTRRGEIVPLGEVLDQATARAATLLKSKQSAIPAAETDHLATTIGGAAVKYTDLMHDRATDVVFDWDKMFSLDGNSIVYLFYAYVRGLSVLRRASSVEERPESNTGWSDEERQLLLSLLGLENAVRQSITHYDPHHLLDHIYQVTAGFSRFYNQHPILCSPEPIRKRRLALTQAVLAQLDFVFKIIGVTAPTKL